MKIILIFMTMLVLQLSAAPAWSGLVSSCTYGSVEPKPEWVRSPDLNLPGYYYGIGSAAQEDRGEYPQKLASETDAKRHLSEQIEVKIKSLNEQSTRINNQNVQTEALSKVVVSTEELLRGLKIKGQWVDKETCKYYTLMVVSQEAVIRAKQEKLMKNRLEQFKKYLAEGSDSEKNRDIKNRKISLENAQEVLIATDFTFLRDELEKIVYEKKLTEALESLKRDSSKVQGRMALFAINRDSRVSGTLVGKMLHKLRASDHSFDHLVSDCNSDEDCIVRAKERGFSKLTLLNVSTKVANNQSGTVQGILTVSKLVYDIESRKVLAGPENISTGVIGWSADELDWGNAVEAAIQRISK